MSIQIDNQVKIKQKENKKKEKQIQKDSAFQRVLPLLITLVLLTLGLWLWVRAFIKLIILYSTHVMLAVPSNWFIGEPHSKGFIELGITVLVLGGAWTISTRVQSLQKPRYRMSIFFLMISGIALQYLWVTTAPIHEKLGPYFRSRVIEIADVENMVYREILLTLGRNIDFFNKIILFLPLVIVGYIIIWLWKIHNEHPESTKAFILKYEAGLPTLKSFFAKQEKEYTPDIPLGISVKTKSMVVQKGKDRTLNSVIIGPIGSGKTSALLLPMINADLHHMTKMINDFPIMYQKENYESEDVAGRYLNGIVIIEPSNDLCQKAYQLCLAHGIPEEAILYIDPNNANTKSINPLLGPVEKVAETFTMVIDGIADSVEFFFQQAQRIHLKQYIYLLKLHNPELQPTFDDLIRMYNDSQLVHHMHKQLKERIPKNIDEIEDRDTRNHWKIVEAVDKWFDDSLGVEEERRGPATIKVKFMDPDSPYYGEDKYFDKKQEHVVGLRNILNDISSSPLIRRVLFGHSDFDYDLFMKMGGVLLVNTEKGNLAQLSETLGRFILLSIQNAVFRRKPNDSPYVSIYVDEFPDYIYLPFSGFTSQSRKYKAIVHIVAQTVAQLSRQYSDDFLQTVLATCRHKFVYGDVDEKTATLFSKMFGEDEKYTESTSEQEIDVFQTSPSRRLGSQFSKEKEVIMSPQDIIFQEKFVCAVKLVKDNEPIKVQQVQANFVPKDEFKQAKVVVDEDAAEYWLSARRAMKEGRPLEEQELLNAEESSLVLADKPVPHEIAFPETKDTKPKDEIKRENDRLRKVVSTSLDIEEADNGDITISIPNPYNDAENKGEPSHVVRDVESPSHDDTSNSIDFEANEVVPSKVYVEEKEPSVEVEPPVVKVVQPNEPISPPQHTKSEPKPTPVSNAKPPLFDDDLIDETPVDMSEEDIFGDNRSIRGKDGRIVSKANMNVFNELTATLDDGDDDYE